MFKQYLSESCASTIFTFHAQGADNDFALHQSFHILVQKIISSTLANGENGSCGQR